MRQHFKKTEYFHEWIKPCMSLNRVSIWKKSFEKVKMCETSAVKVLKQRDNIQYELFMSV